MWGTRWRLYQTVWELRMLVNAGHINLVLGEIYCFRELAPLEIGPEEVGPLEGSVLEGGLRGIHPLKGG
jgi:hypothetical protein